MGSGSFLDICLPVHLRQVADRFFHGDVPEDWFLLALSDIVLGSY